MNEIFFGNLFCPKCHSGLMNKVDFLLCSSCSRQYRIISGIPDFREKDEYWCNVSREKMKELNTLAEKSGNWLSTANKLIPQYVGHVEPFYRADCQFLWPTDKDSRILDAGSMWGGITIPAAQYHKEVYAIDKTMETLEFLKIRAGQSGFHNVYPVASSLLDLPFEDHFFDMVIVSGVLEWVALDQDVVLEKQWHGRGSGLRFLQRKKYSHTPATIQLKVLQELRRVLKPEGSLYLAIENRIGYIYLAGWPDEHMNMPFIGLLPRFIANAITKLFLKSEYRTYVYTISGYRSLLEKAGFSKVIFYGVFNHYVKPIFAVPLELVNSLAKKISAKDKWQLKLLSKFIPSKFLGQVSPSVICLASSNQYAIHESRIKRVFCEAGLISGQCPDFRAVKWAGRLANTLPVNYLIYTNNSKTPSYFCKIARDRNETDAMASEAEHLASAQDFFVGKDFRANIPRLVYYGTVGGITILVTTYLSGFAVDFFIWDKAKNMPLSFYFGKAMHKYATQKWLDGVYPVVIKAISFLNDFQRTSTIKKVDASFYLDNEITMYEEQIKKNGLLNGHISELIRGLREKIKGLGKVDLPLCFEHGDYDLCNILKTKDGINVVDFEHADRGKLPFFDLGNLLFSPLVAQFKKIGHGVTLKEFADIYGWSQKLRKWTEYYSEISGISMGLLRLLPSLAVLEQNAKNYPHWRDPYTYPMYGSSIIEEMLQWDL